MDVALSEGHDIKKKSSKWIIMNYSFDRKTRDDRISSLAKLDLKIFEIVSETYRGYFIKDTMY